MEQALTITTVEGVRGYVDANGTIQLNVEDVARGLGFVDRQEKLSATSGRKTYEVIRWARINGYLADFDYPPVKAGDYIPENMFYRLAMKASNAAAQSFQAKVADVILPSIRKHGVYMTVEAAEKILFNPDFIIKLAQQVKDAQTKIAELQPKADYCDKVLQSKEILPTTIIAKSYGMSTVKFNELLKNLKVQYRSGRTWVLYQAYANLGYMRPVTRELKSGLPVTFNGWTQKGRMFLYNLLKGKGIIPLCERNGQINLFGGSHG